MKLVLDTNVLIAAHVSTHGVCAALLENCVAQHELVTSEFILDEFSDKLVHKFDIPQMQAQRAVNNLRSVMQVVTPSALPAAVCRDPDDDLVLATAIGGNAKCIISGDKDLLDLRTYLQVEIFSPSEFTKQYISDERK